jgi:hypothetical protein
MVELDLNPNRACGPTEGTSTELYDNVSPGDGIDGDDGSNSRCICVLSGCSSIALILILLVFGCKTVEVVGIIVSRVPAIRSF